ncbi:hypothetical protein [Micromonospora echinospora]|uniref:hypothetical protein n=1 Tax=Micromonospora echinospora TaxID=1877 RepID=UPI0036703138
MRVRVDWTLPVGRPDPVHGTGARREERLLATGAGLVAVALVLAVGPTGQTWAAWQYALAALVTFDLAGGVVANGLNSAKRDHHAADSPLEASRLGRLVRRPVRFAVVHVQPVAVGLLFPGASWWWGPLWYVAVLASVVVVRRAALHLQRPVALGCCVVATVVAGGLPAPDGFAWLPVVMFLKLTLAHAVREEPYRPVTGPSAG